jgi:hypothetical protein
MTLTRFASGGHVGPTPTLAWPAGQAAWSSLTWTATRAATTPGPICACGLNLTTKRPHPKPAGAGSICIYSAPEGVAIRNSAGKLGPGLDVRADGGYIVLPPSIHPSGNPYEWAPGFGPDECEIKPLPEPLVRLLAEPPEVRVPPLLVHRRVWR